MRTLLFVTPVIGVMRHRVVLIVLSVGGRCVIPRYGIRAVRVGGWVPLDFVL
jgi:hypothetical protein